jgi:Fe-S oxidoreductase
MEADTLMGNAAVLHAAGINWTIGSHFYDSINYGLFYSDWVMERIVKKLAAEAQRLKIRKVLLGECGHAARTARQFTPTFVQDGAPPTVTSLLDVTWQAIKEGKIELDSNAVSERVTYHDPCNVARSGWIVDQPRGILHSFVTDFVEMQPHGTHNYCCGGGGGLVSLDETHDFRMQIVGNAKAEQIRATGADIVATPCANCKKQLREIVGYYDLPVQIVGVHDLVLRAIKL